jgi:hypothetical protein
MVCAVLNGRRATDQAIILDGVRLASRPDGPKVGNGVALKAVWLQLLLFLRDLPNRHRQGSEQGHRADQRKDSRFHVISFLRMVHFEVDKVTSTAPQT